MTFHRSIRSGALVATAALIAACGGGGPSAAPTGGAGSQQPPAATMASLSGTVTIDGSSTVYPITELVAEEFQTANPGVQVPVAFSGTGGGFKKFCVGETDINDASRPIKAEDEGEGLACDGEQHRLRRAPGRDRRPDRRRQPGERLRDLPDRRGAGQGSTARTPPRTSCGATSSRRSRPSRSSGTCRAPTRGRSTTSPRSINGEVDAATPFATQSEDDNMLVTGVAGDTNAIAFFGYAYYVENQDKLKAVEVDGGGRLRRPDRGDDQRRHLRTALAGRCSSTRTSAKAKTRARAEGVRRLLPRQRERARRRGRLHRRCRTTCSQAEVAEWAAAVGG